MAPQGPGQRMLHVNSAVCTIFHAAFGERVPTETNKVQKHFIIIKNIHKDTAYSLTVCTNTCTVFTYESVVTRFWLAA